MDMINGMDSQNMNTHIFREYDIRGIVPCDLIVVLIRCLENLIFERLDEIRREIETILCELLHATTQAATPVVYG